MQKVSDFIDIEAPCEEVFNIVSNIERRMQLSPLWGLSLLKEVASTYPEPGSTYRVHVTDAPFGLAGGSSHALRGAFEGLAQIMLLKMGTSGSSANHQPIGDARQRTSPIATEISAGEVPAKKVVEADQEYFVDDCEPPHKLGYHLDADCKTIVTWRFQSIPRGTRVNYEEVFCKENTGGEDFLPTIKHVIHEWLVNIKRYSELRGTRGRIFLKSLLDRFYLKLRPDQRRTVLLILFMQGMALITFVIAAFALGIAGLLF